MNGPGGRPIIASAAYRTFHYPGARTVADIDAIKRKAKIAEKVQRVLTILERAERAGRA